MTRKPCDGLALTWLLLLFPAALSAQPTTSSPAFATRVANVSGQFLFGTGLSPDQRWLVSTSTRASGDQILIGSAAGGTLRTLVPASDKPGSFGWFPDNKRFAYESGRVGGIVVVDFDATTGTIRGTPRRITLERCDAFTVSPDGRQIAYVVSIGSERVLKLVPTTGGTARVLFRRAADALNAPQFDADGKSILLTVRHWPEERGSIWRVPTDGSQPVRVWRPLDTDGVSLADARANRIIRSTEKSVSVMTLKGDTVAVFANNGTFQTTRIGAVSTDGRYLYTALSEVGTIMTAVDITQGKRVALSANDQYYAPAGWSSDGREAFFFDEGGRMMFDTEAGKRLIAVNVSTKSRRTIVFDPVQKPSGVDGLRIFGISGDGRHLFVAERTVKAGQRRGYVYDVQSRLMREVADSLGGQLERPGGHTALYDPTRQRFVFLERTGMSDGKNTLPRAVRASTMDGRVEQLGMVPSASDSARQITVLDGAFAWIAPNGTGEAIYLRRGDSAPVKVWSSTTGIVDMKWSHNGRRIAVAEKQSSVNGHDRFALRFIDIDASGRAKIEGTSATFGSYWGMYWTKDDRALIAREYPEGGVDTRLIRIPTSGEPISYVLKPGAATFWDHMVSPDGRYSLVPIESASGASLWRVDLEAAQKAWQQQRAGAR